MKKISRSTVAFFLLLAGITASAATRQALTGESVSVALRGFVMQQADAASQPVRRSLTAASAAQVAESDRLVPLNQSHYNPLTKQQVTRYQQWYRDLPVVGGSVIVHQRQSQSGLLKRVRRSETDGTPAKVSGILYRGIHLQHAQYAPYQAVPYQQQALKQVISAFEAAHFEAGSYRVLPRQQQIRLMLLPESAKSKEAAISFQPVFQVKLLAQSKQRPGQVVAWQFLVDAKHPATLIRIHNSIRHFKDVGPGGNQTIGKYQYGEAGLPFLKVKKKGERCSMETPLVRLVDLTGHQQAGLYDLTTYREPFQYDCGSRYRDVGGKAPGFENGAYSPADDAYFFGGVVVDLYQDWLQLPALKNANGKPDQLVLRVHLLDPEYDEASQAKHHDPHYYDNAFWDDRSRTMNFGDGDLVRFYPLISPSIIGHEVSHGFTSDHADLDYGQPYSGSLNESYSDVAGIATKAYLLEQYPALYQAIYHQHVLAWTVGESIARTPNAPLRDLARPASDGISAECYQSEIATLPCQRSYEDVDRTIHKMVPGDDFASMLKRISYIDHTDSGIFNRLAFELSNRSAWPVRKIFRLFATANLEYWQAEITYPEAVSGLLQSAEALGMSKADQDAIKQAALGVGILPADNDGA